MIQLIQRENESGLGIDQSILILNRKGLKAEEDLSLNQTTRCLARLKLSCGGKYVSAYGIKAEGSAQTIRKDAHVDRRLTHAESVWQSNLLSQMDENTDTTGDYTAWI